MSTETGQPELNWDTANGAYWVTHDDDLSRQYAGKWVVAVPGRVISAGDDPEAVAAEAARILQCDMSTILVRSVVHPDEYYKDYPFYAGLPASQPAG
jgi:ABC-type hemin transport system ATPase subunit